MSESLSALAASFRRDLLAARKAERTANLYLQAVRFFSDYLPDDYPTSEHLTVDNLRDWFGELNKSRSPGTVMLRWQGMNRFCKWLIEEEVLDSNPMKRIERPQVKPGPVEMFDDDELAALIKACAGKRFYDRRDEAIIRLLLDSGLRVHELCGDHLRDVDLDDGSAMILGKGSKLRPAYFGTRTARALDRYQRMRAKHRWAHLDAFFIGERGAMTPDGMREVLKVRGEKAGIKGKKNPHKLRHTWADDFLYSGGQERDLKRLAGWSSDAMLEVYGRSGADRRARHAARTMRRGDRV